MVAYEIGKPCMLGEVVGRIVGESDEGSWAEVNGMQMFSVPLFATPHGSIIKTGILYLKEITDEGMKRLLAYEHDASQLGELYGGKLKVTIEQATEERNDTNPR